MSQDQILIANELDEMRMYSTTIFYDRFAVKRIGQDTYVINDSKERFCMMQVYDKITALLHQVVLQ